MKSSTTAANAQGHALTSDLAKLCLRPRYEDANPRLAWANSICLLFLLVGIVGLKQPRFGIKLAKVASDIVPVMLVPAPEPVKAPTPEMPRISEPLDEAPIDQPVVAAVFAADFKSVAFAVPVPRRAILAAAPVANAPRLLSQASAATPKPTHHVPSEVDWGGHPLPEYPALARQRGYQGKVVLEITAAASGEISSVKVLKSSGYQILDDTALEHVRKHLRLRNAPGEMRLHTIDIIFQLKP